MIKHVNEDEFNEEIKKNVLVDFYASWCGPCKMISSVFEKCHESLDIPIIKIDVDKEDALARKYDVMSIPTLILFKDGKELKRTVGFLSENELKDWVNE